MSDRVGGVLQTVWRGTVADPVRNGRLRDVGWPYGLRAVVVVTVVLYAVAVGLALASSVVRRTGELAVPNSLISATPAATIWLVTFLMVAALGLLHVGALHGPWWAKLLGVTVTGLEMAVWGLSSTMARGLAIALTVAAMAVMVAFSVWRARRPFAWWELPVVLVTVGAVVGTALRAMKENSVSFGFEFAPLLLDELVSTVGYFVLPAALAAGAAVAEITVGATVLATRSAQRLSRRSWPYVLLAVVAAARLAQVGWQLAHLDPVEHGWLALVPAVVMVAAFGGVGWLLVRLARRSGGTAVVSELPEDLGRLGLPVAVAVTAVLIPVVLLTAGLQVLVVLDSSGRFRQSTFDVSVLVDRVVDGFRLLLGVLLVTLAMRLARRGRLNPALLLGGVGVVLGALAMRLLTGYRWALWIDPDSLNLVATVAVLCVIGWYLARRRLSGRRAVALAGALVLCALISSRNFISDPVGAVLGYSGVALVLFGLTWDFLTGSAWANRSSRRFPAPVRVLLVLTYTLLTATLVAYGSLVRKPTPYGDLNAFAEFGDLLLGTALLAAAFVAVLTAVRQERSLD